MMFPNAISKPGLMLCALLLTGTGVASPAAGTDAASPHHSNVEAFREQMARLQLSEQQKQDVGALLQVYKQRFDEIRARGEADRRALLAAAPDDRNYDELVAAVAEEAARSVREGVYLLGELQATGYALLTAEQQAEYRALKAEAEARRADWQAGIRKESSDKDY